ncbi:porin [Salmonella enterica]|uniref:Porin OmpC n=3 Tax=Salmonella enterica TaxID=28901 RepID=A0A3R0UAB7_SALER|nr:porin OmpC [Salmonella enterica subsp. enterica serovar Java]EAO1478087.1 porin OmpC [Salmonella enterica]ECQ8983003.1 porin OmpC [Salmonella enterica subsp. enterica]EHJ5406311.1 porin [Salmonella enterica subsp. enterica serovar Wedding]EIK6739247.1 porin [Salmonella enterica subsp. enterica serovar Aqua]HCM8923785.1 porin [Salmonella enterica subsp. enterica serovar Paratyphi B]
MKKIIVYLALFISSSSYATEIYNKNGNKLDLYGGLRARHYFSDNKNVDGDATFFRGGFKGETQINEKMTGFGRWEYEFKGNNSESDGSKGSKTRLAFAGLKFGRYGSVDYGRNWGVTYDVAAITDIAPIFDELTYSSADNFMTGRATGLLTWRNDDFFNMIDGLNVAAQYQGRNSSGRSATTSNGDGYGFSLSYQLLNTITVLGTYSSSKRTKEQQHLKWGNGVYADVWAGGIKYEYNGLYLAALYSKSHNLTKIKSSGYANEAKSYETVASYQFSSGLKPFIGYFLSHGENIENVGGADIVKYIDIGLSYYFNKNMFAYCDYKSNLLDSNNYLDVDSDDKIGIGITYQF